MLRTTELGWKTTGSTWRNIVYMHQKRLSRISDGCLSQRYEEMPGIDPKFALHAGQMFCGWATELPPEAASLSPNKHHRSWSILRWGKKGKEKTEELLEWVANSSPFSDSAEVASPCPNHHHKATQGPSFPEGRRILLFKESPPHTHIAVSLVSAVLIHGFT